jgi:cytochrome c
LAIGLAAGSLVSNVYADETLAKSKGCLACHAVDKKVVGPGFKEIAAKYKGQSDASAMLVEKVLKGGKGTWGAIPMPPNKLSNDEAQTLVMWVLSRD